MQYKKQKKVIEEQLYKAPSLEFPNGKSGLIGPVNITSVTLTTHIQNINHFINSSS